MTAAARAPGLDAPPAVGIVARDEILRRRVGAVLAEGGVAPAVSTGDVEELDGELDVVVLGLEELDRPGLDAVAKVVQRAPGASVIVVTGQAPEFAARRAVDEGVAAVVLEARLDETLAPALEAVRAGLLAFPGELRSRAGMPVLSAREKQVLGMVVMGYTNGEIARGLHVVEATVKSHLSSSFRKLGVRSRNQATALILDPQSGLGLGILRLSDEDG